MTDTLTNSSSLITASTNQSPVAPLGQSLVTPEEAAPRNLGTAKFKFHLLDMEYSNGLLTFSVLLANFAVSEHKLLPGQKKYLDELVSLFKAYGDDARVTHLIGRASKTGPEGKNKAYAKRRLESVKQYLEERCPKLQILKEFSDGSASPTHVKNEASQLDWNRSVEIRVSVLIPAPKFPKPTQKAVPKPKNVCPKGASYKWQLDLKLMLTFDYYFGVVFLAGRLYSLDDQGARLDGGKEAYIVGVSVSPPLSKFSKYPKGMGKKKASSAIKVAVSAKRIAALFKAGKMDALVRALKKSQLGVSASIVSTKDSGLVSFKADDGIHCYQYSDFNKCPVGIAFAAGQVATASAEFSVLKLLDSKFPVERKFWLHYKGVVINKKGLALADISIGLAGAMMFVK
ncbi:hypothetical protein RN22_21800 [Grimontia sp. AD028]|uniref:hypothetical protein n=1 Tax=Grimontia sp. AD028 TaxID=1581149 RepID=UPI00061AFEAF|nr:hypothetical protein [Grimontia sp. AD028]KKD58293.1 hypothetical protein RN22_21800 [Grimontia sp. AD028]